MRKRVLQYEYTLVPIIKWLGKPLGITIMDGPFMTVLPHGISSNFLLYHVQNTVIETEFATQLDEKWLSPETSPAKGIDKRAHYLSMVEAASFCAGAITI